jgi:hypothetical protein
MQKRTAFEILHHDEVTGKLTMPDRVIFQGHLGFRDARGMSMFLAREGVLLKDFGTFAEKLTAEVKAHAQKFASGAGRPFQYLDSAYTARSGYSKEQMARDIAERDGVTEGLICVLSVLETCGSFDVRSNHETHRREVVHRTRKCLHFYFYFIDPEFGFMHVRLQSWLPLRIQIYINGREWLCQQLDRKGIGYERYDNALVQIDDIATAQRLGRSFTRRRWHTVLNRFARLVNPRLPRIEALGFARFGGYYWVTDQCEIATDVMFKSRAALAALMPDLLAHSMTALSAEDALRFLGRKPSGQFQGEATANLKRRPEGFRVKFRMKRNTIKMYDKWSVLRIETTINNPREFQVLRPAPGRRRRRSLRWMRMSKGVANFRRYGEVGENANARFLEALAVVRPQRQAIDELDRLCKTRTVRSKRVPKFNPVATEDARLFAATLHGSHLLNGFRNKDLTCSLYPGLARSPCEAKRRRERVSRLIAKMRAHGLVSKVPRSRLYRVSQRGQRVMAAVLRFRLVDFPAALQPAA